MGIGEQYQELRKDIITNVSHVRNEDIENIIQWLSKKKYLNVRPDREWLESYLRCCKNSLETTKHKLELLSNAKSTWPDVFVNMDPLDPKMQEMFSAGLVIPMLAPNPGDSTIVIIRPAVIDSNRIKFEESVRIGYMLAAVELRENKTPCPQDYLVDTRNFSVALMSQLTPTNIKMMFDITLAALPLQVRSINLIHLTPRLEFLMIIVRSLLNEKMKSRLKIHTNMESLYEDIPKSRLPEEYGGKEGPIQDFVDYWKNKIESKRDWFLDDQNYKTDESRRPGKDSQCEMQGSFRKLNID